VTDTGQLKGEDSDTPYIRRMGDAGPIDQLRIDNWPEPKGFQTQQVHSVVGGPFRG
jgi:hypothetical protein